MPLPAPQPSPVPEPKPSPTTPGELAPAWGNPNQNFLDITLYTPPDYGYGHGLPGLNQGFVALKANQVITWRARESTTWQIGDFTPSTAKDALLACQKYFPGTWMAQAMTNYNFLSAWYGYAGMPETNSNWFLYACQLPPSTSGSQATGAVPEQGDLGAVTYWYGKVNRHSEPKITTLVGDVTWASDPDGSSGANVDTLAYCKKYFPSTQSVQYIGGTAIDDWKEAGLRNSWKGGGSTYACRTTPQPVIQFPANTSTPVVTSLPTQPQIQENVVPPASTNTTQSKVKIFPWD